ncbi:MAG: sulfide/dihydroorotate dehydrogenase-like FAD/NAD-binding protein [Clostridia bacterium]|jgi:ferredoxin--NADP+ reductase|nr:sulfide/dihydroorotate dehydrogenase-like FAD/NAD-binding protein [Clostridia bacterium]MDD3094592.1 sulfide/dihydroorotate dehydrogenase-like FAD/NAD-binding protein [Clostridia bacterium]MDD3971889.1 sulfide/dihydroorotate dehydrogenase-like FAD/NAD-binding protein [Clostridia bacterium]NLF37469.1 sulfide/dihydroorotate dehydrogenase-like FAD/NAD-binding protein [Clostridiaceae bacterium]
MYKILEKKDLNNEVVYMKVDAPAVAKKCEPGQFIILRVNEQGERIPLTIEDYDREEGWVSIIFQKVGKTTYLLGSLNEQDYILDFVGPLGTASHTDGMKRVCVIGGGLGCAIAFPQAKKLYNNGAHVDIIAGFRNKDLVILQEEMKKASTNYYLMTDDGSAGEKGLVTEKLKKLIEQGSNYDTVIAVGPVIMMKFVSLLTKEYGIKTIVSMNPIMIDGTGMCGGCRLTVGGETKFACVDGPDFDGHLVDFDSVLQRLSMYKEEENHKCNLFRGIE